MTQPARIVAIAVAALFADALCIGTVSAQGRGMPQPPPALPLIPPPVDHPAYLAQPLMQPPPKPSAAPAQMPDGECDPGAGGAPALDPAEERALEFRAVRVVGRDLKSAVQRVVDGLAWHENLLDARANAAATGKPLLWIKALGEIDGFA